MAYSDGEALVLTQLQAVSGFSANNTSRGNWRILNSGKDKCYAIVKPGSWKVSERSQIGTIWRTVIQVYQRYKDDSTSMTDLEGHYAAIKLRFDQYRKLGDTTGTISDSRPIEGSLVEDVKYGPDGPSWLRQEITIEWSEENHVTYAE